MTPLRPHDLVRLRHTPSWTAVVMTTDDELALIEHLGCFVGWLPLDLLELVPGQIERFAA